MSRVTVFCIVEGHTENAVLKKLVAPYLGTCGIDIHFPIVLIKHGRGGVRFLTAPQLFDQMQRFLQDKRNPYVTTFFDYYGLPTGASHGWKFIAELKSEVQHRGTATIAQMIEMAILENAKENIDLPNVERRILPYVQLHELEALFFSEPEKMALTFGSLALTDRFGKIVEECGACEMINDSPDSAPSKRIEAFFPPYKKGRSTLAHGPRIADRLDLAIVREKCPRFDHWVSNLEKLAV